MRGDLMLSAKVLGKLGASLGLDEMRHPEFFGDPLRGRIDVDADDLVGPDQAQALNDIGAAAAETEHDGVAACFRLWPSTTQRRCRW